MVKQVVVGIDGSDFSLSAFHYARHFASRLKCELKAVFVIDTRKTEIPVVYATGHFDYAFARTYIPPDPELKGFYAKIKKDLEGFAVRCLEACAESCRQEKIPFVAVKREGLPSQVLGEESRSGDLLFLGQRGENAHFERAISGSTTEDVARSSARPVMVCPQGFRQPKRLLFPYDGAVGAERALQYCVNAFGGFWTELVVLCSEQIPGLLDREQRYLEQHKLKHRVVVEKGNPVDTVLQVADREKCDVILVGSHGAHRLRDYLLGSTTVHLLRKSHLPVLIVY